MSCQIFAVTDEASLAFGLQSACGTPQTSLTSARYTSEALALTTQSTQSTEIRPDRNVSDLVRTQADVGGPIGFELSYGSFDLFIAGLLQSATLLDGATSAVIKNGKTKRYFTLERNTPVGVTNYFTSFADEQVSQLDLQIQQGQPVSGTFTMLGSAEPAASGTSLDTGGYTAANTNEIYNTVAGVGDVQIDGVSVGSVEALTLSITNNLRPQRALGSVAPAGVASGKFVVTGNISIYFTSNALVTKFLNDDSFDLEITLDDLAAGTTHGNQYVIRMENCKFSSLTNAVPGINQDVLLVGDFQAIYNSSQDGTITVTAIDAD